VPRTPLQALAFLAGFAAALWLSPLFVSHARAQTASEVARLEVELHAAVNALRERHHLVPLARDPALDAVARAHSEDMARRGYLRHESPEGASPVDRLEAAGVAGFTLAAENAGRTSEAAPQRRILEEWLRSASHRPNLFAPAFNATGVGVARAPDGSLVFTQLYVTWPRSARGAAHP